MKTVLILSFVLCAGLAAAQQPVTKADAPVGLASDAPVVIPTVAAPAKKEQKTLPSEASVAPAAPTAVSVAKGPQGVLPSATATQGADKAPKTGKK